MPVGSIELVRTHAIEMPSSQEKLKHIDVVRAVHRRHLSGEQNPHERPRKIREKPYVSLFMKMHGGGKKYKSIQQGDIDPNELQIKINIPEGSDVNRFELGLHFDHLDDVRTIIITDKGFYDGLFYTEVIKTERYKEAWQIMRQRYLLDSWIDKYIYFQLGGLSVHCYVCRSFLLWVHLFLFASINALTYHEQSCISVGWLKRGAWWLLNATLHSSQTRFLTIVIF